MSRTASAADTSALIIAGGRGTRFWPASRAARPKPLFEVGAGRTLLSQTIARLKPLIARDHIFVLVAAEHARAFRKAVREEIPARNLLVEPEARGTAVAIAYGAERIRRRLGDGIVCVMPADHLIEPAAGFRRTLSTAIGLARANHSIVLVGVTPSRAEPGFGYQQIGRKIGGGFRVERFIEKPSRARAERMVKSGRYLWNAGMFVMSNATLDRELAGHCPALLAAGRRIAAMSPRRLAAGYRQLKFPSFDRAVAEKSANTLTVRAQFRWHDVGSWHGLWEAGSGRRRSVVRGNVIALDSEGILAHSNSRLMVLLGVRDLVAIDAGDALLIAQRQRSQDLGRVADELRRRGLHQYL